MQATESSALDNNNSSNNSNNNKGNSNSSNANSSKATTSPLEKCKGPVLVVCRVCDLLAWEDALLVLQERSSDLRVMTYYGGDVDRTTLRGYLSSTHLGMHSQRGHCNIVLTTYKFLQLDIDTVFSQITWDLQVLDHPWGLFSHHRHTEVSNLVLATHSNFRLYSCSSVRNKYGQLPDILEAVRAVLPFALGIGAKSHELLPNSLIHLSSPTSDQFDLPTKKCLLRLLTALTTVMGGSSTSEGEEINFALQSKKVWGAEGQEINPCIYSFQYMDDLLDNELAVTAIIDDENTLPPLEIEEIEQWKEDDPPLPDDGPLPPSHNTPVVLQQEMTTLSGSTHIKTEETSGLTQPPIVVVKPAGNYRTLPLFYFTTTSF